MSKFKEGDKVVCTDNSEGLYGGELEVGAIYTVKDVERGFVHLNETTGGWLPNRFARVLTEAPKEDPALAYLKGQLLDSLTWDNPGAYVEGARDTLSDMLRDVYGLAMKTTHEFVPIEEKA